MSSCISSCQRSHLIAFALCQFKSENNLGNKMNLKAPLSSMTEPYCWQSDKEKDELKE